MTNAAGWAGMSPGGWWRVGRREEVWQAGSVSSPTAGRHAQGRGLALALAVGERSGEGWTAKPSRPEGQRCSS